MHSKSATIARIKCYVEMQPFASFFNGIISNATKIGSKHITLYSSYSLPQISSIQRLGTEIENKRIFDKEERSFILLVLFSMFSTNSIIIPSFHLKIVACDYQIGYNACMFCQLEEIVIICFHLCKSIVLFH